MIYQHSHRHDATGHEPMTAEPNLDPCPIDDGDDEFLDRYLADFRESLADFRSL
jgi:hypothetical protein